jgi:hypothetical protein
VLDELESEGRVVFRYCNAAGEAVPDANPNGSARAIAGIVNAAGNVLGMMPHPERAVDPLAAAAVLLAAGPAPAQATISEGMSGAQVRAAFGAPATTRAAGDWTYWYYHNGCPRRCGSDDVVFFRDGRVVIAAVLRTSGSPLHGPARGRRAGAGAGRAGDGGAHPYRGCAAGGAGGRHAEGGDHPRGANDGRVTAR